ncbi:MAG: hypothetical protein K6E19_06400 [Lachnospiraceae bacterium]|nr:hypothetical protein [Lachnospiraceae bacterium]
MANEKKEKPKRINAFAPISEPMTCSKCGKPLRYKGRGSYICDHCNNVEYDDFGRIDQYIDEHGPSTAPIMSRALGIPIGKIHDLVAQGRLEPIPTSHKTLDSMIYENAMALEEVSRLTGTYVAGSSKHEDDKMRYLQQKKPPSH